MRISISQIRAALCVFLTAIIPFGTRKLLYFFTKGFDEYEAIFLYGTDIVIVLLLLLCFFKRENVWRDTPLRALVPFIAVAGLSIFWSLNPLLAAYAFFRLMFAASLVIVLAVSISSFSWYRAVCAAFVASAVFQSGIGIVQFFGGKSVGLRLLGESQLGPATPGVARVMTEYGRMLRAYGTMPHANIYAAFIMLGLVSCLWLWLSSALSSGQKPFMARVAANIFWGMNTFVLVAGLTVSFSRSGWVSAAVASAILIILGIFTPPLRTKALLVACSLAMCIGASYGLFHFAINPRIAMTTTADYSISSRLTYNKLAILLIRSRPLGVGIGNQVLYSVKHEFYQNAGMTRVWEWQPIHNIYLLMAAETGILGALAFLAFLGILAVRGIYAFWRGASVQFRAPLAHALALFIGVLVFGLADHFPWDLQLGRLMLWCVVGLLFAALHLQSTQIEKNAPVV